MKSNTPQTLPFSTPMQYLWFVTKPFKHWAFLAVFVVVVGAALEQSTSYLFKLIIDAVEAGDQKQALVYGLLFPVALFVIMCTFRLSGLLGRNWATDTRQYGYNVLFSHILNHSHGYFSNRFAGSIHNKMRNVVDGVDSLIPEILWTYVNSFVSLIVTFFFILSIDLLAAGIFALLVVVLIVVNQLLAPKKQELSYQQSAASSKMHGGMIDVISNVSATRQYSQALQEEARVASLINNHYHLAKASWGRTEFMLFVNSIVLFVFSFGLFYILVARWGAGSVTTGEFVLVAALIAQLSGTLIFIGRAFNSTARTFGEIREGFVELLVPYEIVDVAGAQPLTVTEGASIDWQNVTFEYGTNKVFDNFNLTIPVGQRVGLVGSSGAGKTTFVSLLLRQHELTAGAILINDTEIANITQNSLRQAIAVVPQEPLLFHRTIRENIAYGKPDATDADIIAVAKKAQAHEFISALPDGYATMVGERGIKLSGGQKQRVAIARAMLKDAPILVLDEATSALDSESEVEIQKALHILMTGKTVIAIAHRLSTLREMDRIIVLENGQIVEDGTHESLSTADGTYARLWTHQAGGFLTE